jgi:hypothetical protein|tara:strand:- start:131 stop:610 length:480 start_codon:yes stop_codon:yes gene_type:complete
VKITKSQLIKALKKETIKKVNGKYVLYPKKGGKRLGTHGSKKSADDQETAIQISKHGRTGRELESTTAASSRYMTPAAFKKSTYDAIQIDDEDDSDELLGGIKDTRKKNSKLNKTESSTNYGKSIEKIANDRKLKSISKKDRALLIKIANMMKKSNESV